MASGADSPHDLALVSSLYGPGTVAAWYLTTLSVFLAQTLHPKKRLSESIDPDLIATVTLPVVASGHLIWQIRGLIISDLDLHTTSSRHGTHAQYVAAIEAPLNIIETFSLFSVIFFFASRLLHTLRRGYVMAVAGILCFAVDCYVMLSRSALLGPRYNPDLPLEKQPVFGSRGYIVDHCSWHLFNCGMMFLLLILGVIGWLTNSGRGRETCHKRGAQDEPRIFDISGNDFLKLAFMVTYCILVSTLFSAFLFSRCQTYNPHGDLQSSKNACGTPLKWVIHMGRELFPRTLCSITDLDQAVAMIAGATVFGFTIYGVVKSYYKIWARRNATSTLPTREELTTLEGRPRQWDEPQPAILSD